MNPIKWFAGVVLMVAATSLDALAAESPVRFRESWDHAYQGEDASGKHVVGLWTFDGEEPLKDLSAGGQNLTLQGAELEPQGKFGGALLSKPGWPVVDDPHFLARKPGIPREGFSCKRLCSLMNPGNDCAVECKRVIHAVRLHIKIAIHGGILLCAPLLPTSV